MIKKAELTLAAISAALEADKCGQFREHLRDLLPKMDDAYRGTEKPFRRHQGASSIGADCARELQLSWRWATKPEFPERILRLFNRGHLEEARFLAMLMCVPTIKLWFETEDGGQYKWSDYNGHYGSALDGIATGIPDLPNGDACYTEFKTAGDKPFAKVVKNGVRAEQWKHFVQMQQCMKYFNLQYSLYMVVNKNTDELYAEIIDYDKDIADQYTRRAGEIIFTTDALPRISNTKTFFKCKFCNQKDVCHGTTIPEVNCRTCCHWSPEQDGTFSCARNNEELFGPDVYEGCAEHVFDPTLLSGFSYLGGDASRNATLLRTRDGQDFWQGPNDTTSQELRIHGAPNP